MSSFEDAVAHARQQSNTASPSPATRGTLGRAPGPGQRSDASGSFQSAHSNTAVPAGRIVPQHPDASGGGLGMSGELGGVDVQDYAPGGEFQAANDASCVDAHDCANIWPDAQGGKS
jgi:hypothetical protein